MLFPNSCRCSVEGETIRLSSQSSRVRYPYSAPLFFFSFFFSPWEVVSSVCMFPFFFATHHPFQQQMHDQINCKKESYRLSSTCGAPRITPTFRPWTHTSDESYIYQLSLVAATATVSFLGWHFLCCALVPGMLALDFPTLIL